MKCSHEVAEGVKYSLFTEEATDPDRGVYCTFGICGENREEVIRIGDISTSLSFVDWICTCLNEHEVSLVHFYDVVLDFVNKEFG